MLIGLTGLPSSGKSEAAKYLHRVHGFAHVNVGDPIKDMLAGFYRSCGLNETEIGRRLYGDLKEIPDPYLNGKTPRYAMQVIGKELRDMISPSLFADRWADRIDMALASVGNAVSDGMRYLDEIPVLQARGGLLVRLVRAGTCNATGHIAEAQVLPANVEIINDGTLDDMYRKINALLN